MIKNEYTIEDETAIINIQRRNGDNFKILIDKEDLKLIDELNYKIHISWHGDIDGYYAEMCEYLGYMNGKPKYKTLLLHRIIMNQQDTKIKIDHINHNTLDNRKNNLRLSLQFTNLKNRESKNKNNTSGYRNVSKMGKWWCVQLVIEGRNQIIKKFPLDKLEEAGIYAEIKRKEIYGEFAGNN